jgi:hypothetical protein
LFRFSIDAAFAGLWDHRRSCPLKCAGVAHRISSEELDKELQRLYIAILLAARQIPIS